MYSFFFFLLSWADCLLRIFRRIFFRILSSYLITGGKQKHWATKTNNCALLLWCDFQLEVPWWAGTDLAESLLPWQGVVFHPLWEPAPGRTAGTPLWSAISIGHESNKSNQCFNVPEWCLLSSAFIFSKFHFCPILPCVFYLASRLSANSQALVCQIAAGPWQLGGIQWSVVLVEFQMPAVSLQICLGRSQPPSHLRQQIILFILLRVLMERFTKLRNRVLSSESLPNQLSMLWINKAQANHLCLQCKSIACHQEGSLH